MVVPFASASRAAVWNLSATWGITEWWSFLLRPHHARPLEAWPRFEVSFSYGCPLCVRITGRTRLFTFYGSQVCFTPCICVSSPWVSSRFFLQKKCISVAYLNLTSNKVKYMTPFGLCYNARVPRGARVMRTRRERPWLGMLWHESGYSGPVRLARNADAKGTTIWHKKSRKITRLEGAKGFLARSQPDFVL